MFFKFFFLITCPLLNAKSLTLSEYLTQVMEKNPAIIASQLARQAAFEKKGEAGLKLTPTLFGTYQISIDKKPSLSDALFGTERHINDYTTGISQTFRFGLQARVVYKLSDTSVLGSTSTQPDYFESSTALELNFPLWKNGFGRETRARFVQDNAKELATFYLESFAIKMTLFEAEMAFWKVVQTREVIQINQENLNRSLRLWEWNKKRVKSHLTDVSDLYQSEAAVKLRELELQSSKDDEKFANRTFNILRNIQSETTEPIQSLSDKLIETTMTFPSKMNRLDVLAAYEHLRMVVALAKIGMENNLPNLDLTSAISLNGKNANFSETVTDSFSNAHPSYMIGVKFSTPLDFPQLLDNRKGYILDQKSAELDYQKKLLDAESDWQELSSKLKDTKKRFQLAKLIESIQFKKLTNEKDRHTRGRTTTFQVLQAEQDYSSAQLNRLKTAMEFVSIVAKMKTFGGES